MKTLVAALSMGLIVAASSAVNATQWYAGPIGGVNWGSLSGVDQASANSGFTGGAFLQADFTAQFATRLSALYTQKGGENTVNDVVQGAQTTILTLDYVDLPLVLVVNLTGSATSAFSIYAGPVFSFNMSGEVEDDDGEKTDVSNDVNETEFSAVIGAEGEHIRSAFSVFFDFSYTIGATNVFASDSGVTGSLADAKNRGFAIAVGLKFALND